MTTDEPTQSIESNAKDHGETPPTRSRRGFLKQTAAASILGISGMSVAAQTASASKTSSETRRVNGKTYTEATERTDHDEPVSDIEPMDYRGFDKILEIYGRGPWWVDYYIDSNGDIIPAYNTEGDDWVGNDVGGGTIYDGYTDAYYVQYGVDYIGDSDGDVDFQIFDI
jgi:hypothetical protein